MSVSHSVVVGVAIFISISTLYQESLGAKPSCKVCKEFVESFHKRLEDTANSNFAGGDTHWEEEKLGSYADSEVRLVEILDSVCKDYECHRLLEEAEEDVERWWFKLKHKEETKDLKKWLCSAHLDVCCPPNTFGPTCTECPGGSENPCKGHGKCQGSEEKTGKGECSCDTGYKGVTCESCDHTHYNNLESGDCKSCDRACKESCSGPGPESCDDCAGGYEANEDKVCKDTDECKEDESICKDGTYCLNTPGDYRCQACDKSCTVCNGHGPSRCGDCAKGYKRNEKGICEDNNECEVESVCGSGTYCENTPGSYACKACHISCLLVCSGPGPESCEECKSGYNMEDGTCVDKNECEVEPSPCDTETEVCSNLIGSFKCKCKDGLVRSKDGTCAPEETAPKKTKKKKKSKGKKKQAKLQSREGEKERDEADGTTTDPTENVQPVLEHTAIDDSSAQDKQTPTEAKVADSSVQDNQDSISAVERDEL